MSLCVNLERHGLPGAAGAGDGGRLGLHPHTHRRLPRPRRSDTQVQQGKTKC